MNYLVNMTSRKSRIFYWDIKACIEDVPKTVQDISDELGMDYQKVFKEIRDLERLGKIVKVRHDGQLMMLWRDKPYAFEYELSKNIVKIRKSTMQFVTTPSVERQCKLPMFLLRELKSKLGMVAQFDLILEVKAVKLDNVWYKIEEEKIGEKNGTRENN